MTMYLAGREQHMKDAKAMLSARCGMKSHSGQRVHDMSSPNWDVLQVHKRHLSSETVEQIQSYPPNFYTEYNKMATTF